MGQGGWDGSTFGRGVRSDSLPQVCEEPEVIEALSTSMKCRKADTVEGKVLKKDSLAANVPFQAHSSFVLSVPVILFLLILSFEEKCARLINTDTEVFYSFLSVCGSVSLSLSLSGALCLTVEGEGEMRGSGYGRRSVRGGDMGQGGGR